jgi:glycopeptide antibiotics resistance protein
MVSAGLATAVPALILWLIIGREQKARGQRAQKENILLLAVFAFYIGLVFNATGAGTLYDLLNHGFVYRPEQINFFPFAGDALLENYILNAVMFLPFGFLLPLVWPQVNKFRHLLGYSLGFSLFIELSQLLSNRATDVDDLLMNVLGALIGYLLFRIMQRLFKRDASLQRSKHSPGRPALYLLVMAFGWFFLYNDKGLVELMFGEFSRPPR